MSHGSMYPGEQEAPPFDPYVFSAPSSTDSVGSEPAEASAPLDPFLPSSVLGLHDTSLEAGFFPHDMKHEPTWDSSDVLGMELHRVSALSLSTPISQGRHLDMDEPPISAPVWPSADMSMPPLVPHADYQPSPHEAAPVAPPLPGPTVPPPSTPLPRQEHAGRYVPGHPPLATPEQVALRHHSVCSPAELTSPALAPEHMAPQRLSFDQSPSPHKSASLPAGVDMGVPGHGVPSWMPAPPGGGLLDDPFIPMPSFTPPASLQSMMMMEPTTPQHGPHGMVRVYSAPVMPSWPQDSPCATPGPVPGLPHTPMGEPGSFPVSPASGGMGLPVNQVSMARKGYTPYSKSPSHYWGYPDMEYFSSPMAASKSTSALASPLPLSPSTPSAPRRRGGRISHSVSMPGDQLTGLLDFEGPSPARQRGRHAGPPPLVVSSADKLHVCHCGRRFKRMEHLKRHTRTHTQERPHKCPVASCGKSFGRSDNLSQHLKTHFRPSGLVGRTNELLSLHEDKGRKAEARHDPYAAATAAAAAAAAAANNSNPSQSQSKPETAMPPSS